MQPSILRAFGWRFALVLTKDWYHNAEDVLTRIEKLLQGQEVAEEAELQDEEPSDIATPSLLQESQAPAVPVPPLPPPVPTAPQTEGSRAMARAASVSAAGPTTSVRHFEFIGGSSRKFWEISVSGNSFTVRFGRIGTAGQSQTKTFADHAKAEREAQSLIAEKLKKGYAEKPA
jgi:predicted DNA-binding WGR domain protein